MAGIRAWWSAALVVTSLAWALSALSGTAAASGSGSPGSAGVSLPAVGCLPRTAAISPEPATLVSRSAVPGTGGRVLDVVLSSPAMADQQHVYVLLPLHYDASGATRYPVLYLLHGAGGSYEDWVDMGVTKDIDYTSAADHLGPFITVMPDGGAWGFYTDWYGSDAGQHETGPPPAWTAYHIDELIPWVDAHLPVRTDRGGRAIAGLSMGGFGAMSYAARYPDLFAAAGSFSGVTDTDIDFPAGGEALNLVSPGFTHGPPQQCIWGDTLTQGVRWHAGDPTYLAPNLAGVSLFVASGNGQPGPYDTAGSSSTTVDGLVEALISAMNKNFAAALGAAGIAYTGYFYGAGTHSWGYWLRDLSHFLPEMAAAFRQRHTASVDAPFDFRTAETTFSAHGYHFSVDHLAEAFTYLSDVSPGGFSAVGTGTLSVETAPHYMPGRLYRVTIGSAQKTVRAETGGRLGFTVDLGSPTAVQQSDFTDAVPKGFERATVSISAAG